ncbi:coiled-coil domain-containing protein 94 homolog [Morus notabilis]|uniref:coiled-coil domain-containing protein 94 homolog n=1 Tax=Morus notabilis TaxID=981085 RepID=UPI000CECEEBF|nr:coiled-coil domain-containing protein 94 homolog [Morus notabilis]
MGERKMLSMGIRCNLCGNFMYRGTKVNARKEDVIAEKYLGSQIQIYRFYFRCSQCAAEIIMKPDPQNSDYVVESGSTRNFEPWRDEDERVEKEKREREIEEMRDPMKSLENTTMDSKRTMDNLANLEELKSIKSRYATIKQDATLEALNCTAVEKEKKLDEEDEAQIKSIITHNSRNYVQRIREENIDDDVMCEHLVTELVEAYCGGNSVLEA